MSSGPEHRSAAALVVGASIACYELNTKGEVTLKPFAGAGLAAFATNLPDVIEPAIHPHHRQFFHSLTFAALLCGGLYKGYQCKPVTLGGKVLRFVGLVGGAAYLIHLGKDAMTKRSLPVFGRL